MQIPKQEKRKIISLRLPENLLKEIDMIKKKEKCDRTHIIEFFLKESLPKYNRQEA